MTHNVPRRQIGALIASAGIPLVWPRPSRGAQLPSPGAGNAPAVMLAQNWEPTLNPANYLVSEKLDGVRGCWDGEVLQFRSGRPIDAPGWFLAGLPRIALDGELWMARRSFDRLSGAVRTRPPVDSEWREVRYMVFDLPQNRDVFSQRAAQLTALVERAGVPWLQAVIQQQVADRQALAQRLRSTVAAGGEGLMLHRADALWQPGRSDALRKLKLQPDEDATVVAIIAGRGRHAGRMGALRLQLADGQQFSLGTGFTDAERESPPPVGSVVTFRYRDRTPGGLPRFASFLRIRQDG